MGNIYSDISRMVGLAEAQANEEGFESAIDAAAEIASRAGQHRIANLILDMKDEDADYEALLEKAASLRNQVK